MNIGQQNFSKLYKVTFLLKLLTKFLWKTKVFRNSSLKNHKLYISLYCKELTFLYKNIITILLKKSHNFLKSSIYTNNNY